MKAFLTIGIIAASLSLCSCGGTRSGGDGITGTEIYTRTHSFNDFDLEVSPNSITYTIDYSTAEGRVKLNGLNLNQAKQLALEEAAIKNNAARIMSPKFSHLKKGKQVLRVTVFGFPARYKNSTSNTYQEKRDQQNLYIIK